MIQFKRGEPDFPGLESNNGRSLKDRLSKSPIGIRGSLKTHPCRFSPGEPGIGDRFIKFVEFMTDRC